MLKGDFTLHFFNQFLQGFILKKNVPNEKRELFQIAEADFIHKALDL